MNLLARVKGALPHVSWESAVPARVSSEESLETTCARIARRVSIELDGAKNPLVILNDESRTTNPDLVATVVRASKTKRVLFARGSHPLPAAEALRSYVANAFAKLSSDEISKLDVTHHVAKESHPELAGSRIHRLVLEADKIVALGSVEPHYFAGWTGAHKTATIGVMALESIQANHEGALAAGSRVLALQGNPVFHGIEKVANALGDRLLCVNEVQVEGKLIAWAAGTWRAALEQVLPAAKVAFVREVPGAQDLLVAAVDGPLGRNLYQAEKGIKNSEDIVADGGAVVLVAPCPDGTGPARFLDLLAAAKDHAAAIERVRTDGYRLGDHKAVKVRALEARGVRWHLACPGLLADSKAKEAVRAAGLAAFGSLEEALAAASRGNGAVRRGTCVADAGNLVVSLNPTS